MDPLTLLLSGWAALGLGAAGAVAAVFASRKGGGQDVVRLRHMVPHAPARR